MKQVKISKRDLKEPVALLKKLGAVNEDLNRAFPEFVFMNKEDYNEMRKNVEKLFQKQYPILKKKSKPIATGVGMHMLNYGPNERLGSAIKRGFVLVDERSMNTEITELKILKGK